MRITSITVRNYRLHRELSVELDPFRTLIGGPNESGKSTLIEAAHRGLFLKSKISGEARNEMLSKNGGRPEVEIRFEAAGKSYKISKRFGGNSGTSTLDVEGGRTLQASEAEEKLAEILGVPATNGRGAGQSLEQWAHLWVLQGNAGEDPTKYANEQKDSLLERLQNGGGAALIQSELDRTVAEALAKRRDTIFSKAGEPLKNSDLGKARERNEEASQKLALASESVSKLRQAISDFEEADKAIVSSAEAFERTSLELKDVRAKLDQVALLRPDEQKRSDAARTAAKLYEDLLEADSDLRELRKQIASRTEALAPKSAEEEKLATRAAELKKWLAEAENLRRTAAGAARAARLRHELSVAYVGLFEKRAQRDLLAGKRDKVIAARAVLAGLEERHAKLPAIDDSRLEKLQTLESESSNAAAKLDAIAASIELVSASLPVLVGDNPLQAGSTRVITDECTISVGTDVRLRIRPGGGSSLAEARRQQLDRERALRSELDALGIATTAQAAQARFERQQIEAQIESEKAHLKGLGAESAEREFAEAERAFGAVETEAQRRAGLVDGFRAPADSAAARALLDQGESVLRAAESTERDAEAHWEDVKRSLEAAETELAERLESYRNERNQLAESEARLRVLLDMHGQDQDRADRLRELLGKRSEAQASLDTIRRELELLQPELQESSRIRLERAISTITGERHEAEKKQERAKSLLFSDGTSDPLAALAAAESEARLAEQSHAAIERRANAVKLLHELFAEEQRVATDTLTAPLAEKITDYLRCIFGPGARAKIVLEGSQLRGIEIVRPDRDLGAFEFSTLSAGTREQLSAAVRLAMAELLAEDHDGCLPVVFDDAFANSDPERVKALQRMLDLAAERGLQVIILSCSPGDYLSLGAKTISLVTVSAAA